MLQKDFCNTIPQIADILQSWSACLKGAKAGLMHCDKRSLFDYCVGTAQAMAAMTRLATVDQLLRKAPAVLDASGTPDGFDNLGGVISWIKSLSASVSNGLRSILKFEGAAFAASL
jgi:hypothetical protein